MPEHPLTATPALPWADEHPALAALANAKTSAIVEYIVDRHHAYLRRMLPGLCEQTRRLALVHGDQELGLRSLALDLDAFQTVMAAHMRREEEHVFPAVVAGRLWSPVVQEQVLGMQRGHEHVEQLLRRIDRGVQDLLVPPWAGSGWHVLNTELQAVVLDSQQHEALEHRLLMPRLVEATTEKLTGAHRIPTYPGEHLQWPGGPQHHGG